MVKAHSEVGHAIIEITDNGPGLPERLRDELFQLFARSSRAGGSGLGLSVARDLMLGHGGDISSACAVQMTVRCFGFPCRLSLIRASGQPRLWCMVRHHCWQI